MAITTLDGLVAGLVAAKTYLFARLGAAGSITSVNGVGCSLWAKAATSGFSFPTVGSTPATGAGAACTSSTAGAIPLTAAGGANTLYLAAVHGGIPDGAGVLVYDRLVHTSGLSGTSTAAQTVNSTALTRNTGGDGNELWLEWYTATGSTAVTVTAVYTNQAGTGSKTTRTVSLPASCPAGSFVRLPLATGDTGLRSVQSVTLSASTGTVGNFGVTILLPLDVAIASVADRAVARTPLNGGLVAIDNVACIAVASLGYDASNTLISITVAEG